MTLETALAVLGPALTTFGAGLLAYDVLRAPVRLTRRRTHARSLSVAEQRRADSVESLSNEEDDLATGEHEVELAGIHANFARTVDRVQGAYDDADTKERDRAFQLAIAGLALVVLGGVAETIAAAIAAAAHSS